MTLQRFLLGCMILMGCLTSSAFCAETTLKGEIVDLQGRALLGAEFEKEISFPFPPLCSCMGFDN